MCDSLHERINRHQRKRRSSKKNTSFVSNDNPISDFTSRTYTSLIAIVLRVQPLTGVPEIQKLVEQLCRL